jgi:hypothetical protein
MLVNKSEGNTKSFYFGTPFFKNAEIGKAVLFPVIKRYAHIGSNPQPA